MTRLLRSTCNDVLVYLRVSLSLQGGTTTIKRPRCERSDPVIFYYRPHPIYQENIKIRYYLLDIQQWHKVPNVKLFTRIDKNGRQHFNIVEQTSSEK